MTIFMEPSATSHAGSTPTQSVRVSIDHSCSVHGDSVQAFGCLLQAEWRAHDLSVACWLRSMHFQPDLHIKIVVFLHSYRQGDESRRHRVSDYRVDPACILARDGFRSLVPGEGLQEKELDSASVPITRTERDL